MNQQNKTSQIVDVPRIALVFLFLIIGILAVCGYIPLTYDEAWNFSNIVVYGKLWIATNYPFPNNHVLFSLLQETFLPFSEIYKWPPLLRVPNIIWGAILLFLVDFLLKKEGHTTARRLLSSITLIFCAPIVTTYFFVARGYIVGIILALIACILATKRKPIHSALCSALAAYSVPTFGFIVPGLGCYMLITSKKEGSLWKWLKPVIVLGATFTLVTGILYFPIYDQVASHSHEFIAYPDLISFLRAFSFFFSSISEYYRSVWLGCLYASIGICAGFIGLKKYKTQDSILPSLCIALTCSWISMFSLSVIGFICGGINLPFLRSISLIPFFVSLSIILISFTFQKGIAQRLILSLLTVQAAFGFFMMVHSFFIESPLSYPYFGNLAPSPIERALRADFPLNGSSFIATQSNQPVLSLYSSALGFAVRYEKNLNPEAPCLIGDDKPSISQLISIERDNLNQLICY